MYTEVLLDVIVCEHAGVEVAPTSDPGLPSNSELQVSKTLSKCLQSMHI